jgi:hypothetical protein
MHTRLRVALILLALTGLDSTPSHAQPRGAAPADVNGFKVGDTVQVDTAFGWVDGQIVGALGNDYRVRVTSGTVVSKSYPAELHRKGPYTARDREVGLYELRDRVQVNVQGTWIDGEVITTRGLEYEVQLPGNRSAWASGTNIRFVAAKAAPATAKSGVPPKPGFVSCAGKIEGRYATTGGFGSMTIVFRSGKATVTLGPGAEDVVECWTAGDKILLHKPGEPTDLSIDINLDGSLQTPFGEIKKKGN